MAGPEVILWTNEADRELASEGSGDKVTWSPPLTSVIRPVSNGTFIDGSSELTNTMMIESIKALLNIVYN
jgi:hypothetical protein